MKSNIELRGSYEFSIENGGKILTRRKGKNLVVAIGKNRAAASLSGSLVFGDSIAEFLNFGDSGITPDEAQTGLLGTVHFPFTIALAGLSLLGNIYTCFVVYTNPGSALLCREMGIFYSNSNSSLFARFTPGDFTFASGDTISFYWSLEVG